MRVTKGTVRQTSVQYISVKKTTFCSYNTVLYAVLSVIASVRTLGQASISPFKFSATENRLTNLRVEVIIHENCYLRDWA